MAVTKNRNRQEIISAWVDIGFADLAGLSGTATEIMDLPTDAVVIGGDIVVDTAFNSATSDVIVIGDSAVANRYYASASIAAAGRNALLVTGYKTLATTNKVRATWTGVGAVPTAGALRVRVDYIKRGRGAFSQG